MKYMIASDFHGSYYYTKLLMDKFNLLGCDKLVCLGDVLYHGPRNPLPKDYNPELVFKLLKEYSSKIMWIKGNCDSEVDEMVLDTIPCVNEGIIVISGVNFYLSHGHIINKEFNNLANGDYLINGHTHVAECIVGESRSYLNPGSISLPKGDVKEGSYMIIDDHKITCYTFSDEILFEVKYA